jgi:hypothetical protein
MWSGFRSFLEDLKKVRLTDNELLLCLELCQAMAASYDSDAPRQVKVNDLLSGICGRLIVPTGARAGALSSTGVPTSSMNDGACTFRFKGSNFLVLLQETTNELGSTNIDPVAQGLQYLRQFFTVPCACTCSQLVRWRKAPHTIHIIAGFLVVVIGAHIGVWGVVCNARQPRTLDAVPLTPLMPCYYHPANNEAFMNLARMLVALRNGVDAALTNGCVVAYIPDLRMLDGKPVSELRRLHKSRLLFTGLLGTEPCAIKFVRKRYGTVAHEKASAIGMAPRMLAFEDIGGTI